MLSIQIKSFGEWRDLDYEETSVPLNYEQTVLINPTKYATEFTKSINLPLTANNMHAFGVMNQLDSVMTTELSLARRIPCRIFEGSTLLLEGTFHVSSVDLFNRTITGNVYSKLNEWMNTLLSADFGNGIPKFIGEVYIDKNFVKYSFESDPSTRNTSLVLPGEEGYNIHDFIGMAPTVNGDHNDFDSSSIVYNKNSGDNKSTFATVWKCLDLSSEKTEEAADVLQKPLERMMLQYRSYNQKPYIYIDSLTRLIQKACADNPEIPDMELDPEWFNENNSDWRDVVYLLPNLVYENAEDESVIGAEIRNGNFNATRTIPNTMNSLSIMRTGDLIPTETGTFETFFDSGWFIPDGSLLGATLICNISDLNFTGTLNWGIDYPQGYYWDNPKVILIGNIKVLVEIIDENNTVIAGHTTSVYDITSGAFEVYGYMDNDPGNKVSHYNWTLPAKRVNVTIDHTSVTSGSRYKIRAGLVFDPGIRTYGDMVHGLFTVATPYAGQNIQWSQYIFTKLTNVIGTDMMFTPVSLDLSMKKNAKTEIYLDEKRFWPYKDENSPFAAFLKYCKLMNLYFWYDSFRDKITVMPKETFYHKALNERNFGEVEDWTSKLDLSRECTFRPIQWDKKYLELNYEATNANKISDFEQEYGITYGTKKIETMYQYNTDTEKFLDGKYKINASAEQSIYMRSLHDYKVVFEDEADVIPSLVKESYIINRKEESSANVYNCFFYRMPSKHWDTTFNLSPDGDPSPVYITDDSTQEEIDNKYCYQNMWSNNATSKCLNAVEVDQYPVLTHYDPTGNGKCLLFSQPAQDYFDPDTIERNSNDLYTRRWSKTIEEIRNEQNKVLECYLWLTAEDWMEICGGKFIRLENTGNCIYLVNKVFDYQQNGSVPTKVELLQIRDLTFWTQPYRNNIEL